MHVVMNIHTNLIMHLYRQVRTPGKNGNYITEDVVANKYYLMTLYIQYLKAA